MANKNSYLSDDYTMTTTTTMLGGVHADGWTNGWLKRSDTGRRQTRDAIYRLSIVLYGLTNRRYILRDYYKLHSSFLSLCICK